MPKKKKAKKRVSRKPKRPVLMLMSTPVRQDKKVPQDILNLRQSIQGAMQEFLEKPSRALIPVITTWMESYCNVIH